MGLKESSDRSVIKFTAFAQKESEFAVSSLHSLTSITGGTRIDQTSALSKTESVLFRTL